MSVLSACRKSLFAPLPVQFSELGKFRKLLDWTRKGLFAPFTLSPLLCCGAAFHSFLTVSKDGHVVSVLSACRKSLFAPLPVQFSELGKFRKLLDWTRKGLFAPFTLSPLLCCGAAFHSFLTVSKDGHVVSVLFSLRLRLTTGAPNPSPPACRSSARSVRADRPW